MHFVLALLLLGACGGGDDAPDVALDSATPPADGGMDAGPSDAARDTRAPIDAPLDAVVDSAADTAADTGPAMCDPTIMPQPNAGLLTEVAGDSGCPAGMARVDTFCIDRYEAILAEVGAGGALSAWSPYFTPAAGVRVRALSVANAVPQGYISGEQAAGACAEAGKRLCTDTEWLTACRGSADRIYPYGDTREDGRCNDARATHPAVELFGTSADWIWSMLDHPCLNQLPDSLDHTGENAGCQTPEGVFDLMGNLHEWTADPAGTFRGGFYVDTRINGEGCLYATTAHAFGYHDYSTGFRCCADAI